MKQAMGKEWEKLEIADIEDIESGLLKEVKTIKHFSCNEVLYTT